MIILMLLITLFLSACGEIKSVHYNNIEAARADGAFSRGWLPDWLPEWAEDIHEIHDLDTNVIALSFYIPPWSETGFRDKCEAVNKAPDPRIRVTNMPRNIAYNNGVIWCDGFYVDKPEGRVIYAWKN